MKEQELRNNQLIKQGSVITPSMMMQGSKGPVSEMLAWIPIKPAMEPRTTSLFLLNIYKGYKGQAYRRASQA